MQRWFWGNGSQVRAPTHHGAITVRHHHPGHLHWLACHHPSQLCPQRTASSWKPGEVGLWTLP